MTGADVFRQPTAAGRSGPSRIRRRGFGGQWCARRSLRGKTAAGNGCPKRPPTTLAHLQALSRWPWPRPTTYSACRVHGFQVYP